MHVATGPGIADAIEKKAASRLEIDGLRREAGQRLEVDLTLVTRIRFERLVELDVRRRPARFTMGFRSRR